MNRNSEEPLLHKKVFHDLSTEELYELLRVRSEEWTLKMVRTMIEKLKKQGWTFTLIGTDNL